MTYGTRYYILKCIIMTKHVHTYVLVGNYITKQEKILLTSKINGNQK